MSLLLNPGGSASAAYTPPTTGSGDPTTAFDSSQGYYKNATYFNTTTETAWICKDATAGAAKWQKLANSNFNGYRTGGVWYDLFDGLPLVAGSAAINTSIYLNTFPIREKIVITDLAGYISTLSAAGHLMLGIYALNAATGRPTGNPLASVVGLATDAVGPISAALGSPVTIDPGYYWAGSQMDNSTSRPNSVPNTSNPGASMIGSSTLASVCAGATAPLILTVTNTYGTFPDLTSASFSEATTAGARPARIYAKTQ